MQREQNLWGLQCLLWPTHAKLLISAADSVQAFQFQAPTYLKNALCLFNCLFHCLSFSILLHGFERFLDVHTFICPRFFAFFPHTSFYTFSHLRIPFFCFLLFLLFSFFFSVYFSFIPSFRALVSSPSTLFFCALHLTRLSPCLFQFSSQSSRKVRLLTTHIPPNSPRIVVIMLILTTLGWCPLNVISSKISAFLSADFQSTGSLTFKSHVPVFVFIPCHYLSRMYHNSR